MKLKHYIYIIALSAIALSSCKKDNQEETPNKDTPVTESKKLLKQIDEYISSVPTKYADNFIPTDFIVCVNAFKPSPLDKDFVGVQSGLYTNCVTRSSYITPNPNMFSVKINKIHVDAQPQKTKSAIPDYSTIFGTVSAFDFSVARTKNESIDTTINIYIPELIKITSPAVTSDDDFYPLCYYKNFILRWNADLNNKNGVIVCVEWLGTLLYQKDDTNNQYIRRTDFIAEDNGKAVLNEQLFEGIPDTGLVYITLLRGNLENIRIDDHSYKIGGESHAQLQIILVRNIKSRTK